MTRHAPAEIVAVGMVTPVGLCAAQTAASVRTGIGRFIESPFTDRHGNPLIMGLAEGSELPGLVETVDERRLSARHERLVRLGGAALAEAVRGSADDRPPIVCMGLPDARPDAKHPVGAELVEMIALQAQLEVDVKRSLVHPVGRAAGLVALDSALGILDRREADSVVVGAVDSYFDSGLLDGLDREGRVKTEKNSDGFIPGEGAAFITLARARSTPRSTRPRIVATATGDEPGHLYSDKPFHGEGLAAAIRAVFDATPPEVLARRTNLVYAGFNGESHWAKEWGVSHIRNADRFTEPLNVEHPADCMGDSGAALGLIMLGLATFRLNRASEAASALVWCSSDRGERAAALITQDTPTSGG